MTLLSIAAHGAGLEETFRNPPPDARPWVRWWWPGGAVQDTELRREVELLASSGFGGAEIQPFNPGITGLSNTERQALNEYATPEFFARMRTAVSAAAASGIRIDNTFGSAWPSGGGLAITPELALVELTVARTAIEGGVPGPVKVTLPPRTTKLGALSPLDSRSKDPRVADWPARMDARQKIVAVIAVKGSDPQLRKPMTPGGFKLFGMGNLVTEPGKLEAGSTLVLTDKLRPDGTLDWSPQSGHWQVLVFKQYAASMSVFGGVGEGPQLVLDHFKSEAFDAHARRVGDPLLAALGADRNALRATFVDSLELMPDVYWSEDFLEQFRTRRGYDLTPFLPLILQPGWMEAWDDHYSPPLYDMGHVGERVRADYQQTVSDLFIERFVVPYIEWNRRAGTQARFQAHGAPVDLLRGYGLADIPETEDLFESSDPFFLRLARSAADIYGRKTITAESFVWQGRPFAVTPSLWRQRADLLFASGVNELIFHGFPYVLQSQAWPGWHPFAPSGFTPGFSTMFAESNPLWVTVPALARYVARTQAVVRSGRGVVPAALFIDVIGYFHGIEDSGAGEHRVEEALLAGGYDHDRINAHALASARVENRQLVTVGGARFSVLVLPRLEGIAAETAERLVEFARQGLPIVFVDVPPSREKGYFEAEQRDRRVQAAVAAATAAGARAVPLGQIADTLRTSGVPANLKFTGDSAKLLFVQRSVDGRAVYFIHNNSTAESRDASFETAATGAVERWNAMDGSIEPYPATSSAGISRIALRLAPGESALLVLDPSKQAGAAPAHTPVSVGQLALPAGGWAIQAKGHGKGGRIIDVRFRDMALSDWRSVAGIEDLAGIATYTRKVRIDRSWLAQGARVVLELGAVHDAAVVRVNGRTFDPLLGPFRVDVTSALRAGTNELAIDVVNAPNNALVDPKKPGFSGIKPQAAGLVGPVVLRATR